MALASFPYPEVTWSEALQGKCPQWGPRVNNLWGSLLAWCSLGASAAVSRKGHMFFPSGSFHSCHLFLMPYFWKKQNKNPTCNMRFTLRVTLSRAECQCHFLIILTKTDLAGESQKNEHDSCKISIFLWFYGLIRCYRKKQLISSNDVRQTDENMFCFV